MKTLSRTLIILAAAAVVAGCVHTAEEIASVRSAGVSADTLRKIEHRGVLTPADIIELHRRGVRDSVVIRHLEEVGVNYIPQKEEIKKLRSAGVQDDVIAALVHAGNRFAGYLSAPGPYHPYWADPYYYPYYPRYYYDPWWPYGGVGIGYGYGPRYRYWR